MAERFVGLDVGAETLKLVELRRDAEDLHLVSRRLIDHRKRPDRALSRLVEDEDLSSAAGLVACGRLSRSIRARRVPTRVALARAARHAYGSEPITLVTIGSHEASVLEIRENGREEQRKGSRCSQGTGSFLRQLTARLGYSVSEAAELVESVVKPAALSGRCPVILKTDMTHLANQGECHARILAGLFDAVCENVQALLKPASSPRRVVLGGGVARSARVRARFKEFLEKSGMHLLPEDPESTLFLEALGCALLAEQEGDAHVHESESLWIVGQDVRSHRVPALKSALSMVRILEDDAHEGAMSVGQDDILLGLDIGSTGAKIVALARGSERALWQAYEETRGDPVAAARRLVARFVGSPLGGGRVVGFGVTGSGREIVGSLLATCYEPRHRFVLNEIAAHARGAVHYDPRVDTIFEIGGQDAKYIRLEEGRIIDAALNEACSAGTGSFIAEQGTRIDGFRSVEELNAHALAAPHAVALGQHCSIFMAEVIDDAVQTGEELDAIVAGLYDSVIQNYLNRVKGNRSIGQVIFCQGMPFKAPALAAAVARRTQCEVIVPPNPGTVGALGIALLADDALPELKGAGLDLQRFLRSNVQSRKAFVCASTKGCGGAGNRCRIDRIEAEVEGRKQVFTWGGACSLYDKSSSASKLPGGALDPFRERAELAASFYESDEDAPDRPAIAFADEFVNKGLTPFFATFFRGIGLRPAIYTGADRSFLKAGIARANVPYCAPMQQYHGISSAMAAGGHDYVFLPMIRSLSRIEGERTSVTCPISQGSADVLKLDLGSELDGKLVAPLIDFDGEGMYSESAKRTLIAEARRFGVEAARATKAFDAAVDAQEKFERACLELGRQALEYCRERGLLAILVLGRPYTIHNDLLNSNVPAILRTQGVIPIPLDCFPIDRDVPVLDDIYWGWGQKVLRAAHQARRSEGLYTVLCSNYSCGPDSFVAHFLGYAMEGKPYALIETDGHSGDAGTRTRLEAFLHCSRQHAESSNRKEPTRLDTLRDDAPTLARLRERGDVLLVPRLSNSLEAVAAALRSGGIRAELLPFSDERALELGQRLTSGKECLPLSLTLGSVLARIETDDDRTRRYSVLMPTTRGPCRFGCYKTFYQLLIERLGSADRISVWSPEDSDYFKELGPACSAVVFAGIAALDAVEAAVHHVRPGMRDEGCAERLREQHAAEISRQVEAEASREYTPGQILRQVFGGGLFGLGQILRRAAHDFSTLDERKDLPVVALAGEIYVRLEEFANSNIVRELERRGLRVRVAPLSEWFEYSANVAIRKGAKRGWRAHLSKALQDRIQDSVYRLMAEALDWPRRHRIPEILQTAEPLMRADLWGEAVLTIGTPLTEWRAGVVDGAVTVGPLECMPGKLAEAQLHHARERDGIRTLALSFTGEPVDAELLDAFAHDVHRVWAARCNAPSS